MYPRDCLSSILGATRKLTHTQCMICDMLHLGHSTPLSTIPSSWSWSDLPRCGATCYLAQFLLFLYTANPSLTPLQNSWKQMSPASKPPPVGPVEEGHSRFLGLNGAHLYQCGWTETPSFGLTLRPDKDGRSFHSPVETDSRYSISTLITSTTPKRICRDNTLNQEKGTFFLTGIFLQKILRWDWAVQCIRFLTRMIFTGYW